MAGASAAGTSGAGSRGSPMDAAVTDGGMSSTRDSAVVVEPSSPTSWNLKGKGLWIWYFAYTGLTAAQCAEKAQAAHVGYVLIKSGQDASFWSTRFNADSVKEFTSRGMRVLAWPYVTPANIAGSVKAALQAADVPGTDGLVLDVESEWEKGGPYDAAVTQLCEGIRAGKPGVWLAYTSFGWIGYHAAFPWKAFDAHCGDAYFPQVYWSDRGVSWSSGYQEALDQLSKAGLSAPNWLIQSNDDISGSSTMPATADLNAFFDKAGGRSSLWELPEVAKPAKLAQLPDLHLQNP